MGLPIAQWISQRAGTDLAFKVDFVDLAEYDLPFMDEPNHPRLRKYEHEHTRRWSARVAAADAFILVMPEYNHGFNAPLKNALDYLHHEWRHKPVGLVSYGGISAGTRAAQMIKQVLLALRMHVVTEAVTIPFVATLIDDAGRFHVNGSLEDAAAAMLAELSRVETTSRALRDPAVTD